MTTCVDQFGKPAPCQSALSYADRAKLAENAGFTGGDLLTILAISQAESGGIPNNKEPGGQGYGLVQIDLSQHPNVSVATAINPQAAFNYAHQLFVSSGNRFTDWVTYTTTNPQRSYKQYLQDAMNGVFPSLDFTHLGLPGQDATNNIQNTLANPGAVASNVANSVLGQVGPLASNIGKATLPYVVIVGGLLVAGVFLLKSLLPKGTA